MVLINDREILMKLIYKYELQSIFPKEIIPLLELHMFKKNEHICFMNEELKYLYFFIHGKAKVYKTLPNGKSLLLEFYEPIQLIGDLEVISKVRANCSIKVLCKSLCIAIPVKEVNNIALKDLNFLMYITKNLSKKLERCSVSSSITITYNLETKLANYLLARNEHIITIDNYSNLAELLGTSYRHLNRTLNKLIEDKIISKEKNEIKILNIKALESLCIDLKQ